MFSVTKQEDILVDVLYQNIYCIIERSVIHVQGLDVIKKVLKSCAWHFDVGMYAST